MFYGNIAEAHTKQAHQPIEAGGEQQQMIGTDSTRDPHEDAGRIKRKIRGPTDSPVEQRNQVHWAQQRQDGMMADARLSSASQTGHGHHEQGQWNRARTGGTHAE